MKKCLLVLFFVATMAVFSQANTTLDLIPPGGALSGSPGSTVGWGFTITNDTNYLLVTGSEFLPSPLSSFGTYTDFTGSQFILVGPSPESPSVTEMFDANTLMGLGMFQFANTASGSVVGNLVVHYQLFSVSPNDPNFNPDTDLLVADGSLSAPASANVAAVAVPEPASALLIITSMPLLASAVRRRLRRG